MPYYGLCVRIEDQQGHEAVIEYAGSRGKSYEDTLTGGCAECGEDVASKGRIKYIKLRSRVNGEYHTRWTLLYFHRKIAEDINAEIPWLGASSDSLPKELVQAFQATLEGTDLGGLYRNLADFALVAAREEEHLAGLAAEVAPAPVVRVPFLSTDVHDLDGLGVVADHLFGRA